MDLCFSKRELSWLDDLMPESKKKKLDDAKKKEEEEVEPGSAPAIEIRASLQSREAGRAAWGGGMSGILRVALRPAFLREGLT